MAQLARFFASVAIALPIFAGTPTGAVDRSAEAIGDGSCFYADRFAPLLAQGVVFADCDRATIEQSGPEAVFSFTHTHHERSMEFLTTRKGDRWEITAIRLRSGEWRDAKGQCTIYRRNQAISTLTCATTRGPRLYAANFEVSRHE